MFLDKASYYVGKLEIRAHGTALNQWINNDIKPLESGRRQWTSWTFHNFWVLGGMNISGFLTGSSLIALGLSWWQAVLTIIVGSILSAIFLVLNSVPGAYYHIGFPVVNRYVWGLYGSGFVVLNRILLSIVWYGFQSWIGGECVYVCLMAMSPNIEKHIPNKLPESMAVTSAQFLAYVLFCLLSLPFIYIRPHKLQPFMVVSSIIGIVFQLVLLIWALATMGPAGFGDTIKGGNLALDTSLGWTIIYGITSVIGSIAAGILNQNDYARFARKPQDAIMGQVISFPFYNILCAVFGILVTAATQVRYGAALWNLPQLFVAIIQTGGPQSRAAVFFAGIALIVSQLGINIPGNALSGGFDFASTFPRFINIRRGGYITALLSLATCPWTLVNTATVFLAVLGSYSVFTGPMIGLMIASYYIVNRRKLNIDDLFVGNRQSVYWYTHGVNWRAVVAWAVGVAPSLPGFIASVNPGVNVSQSWIKLYYVCFLSGSLSAAALYSALHYFFPAPRLQQFVAEAPAPRELMAKYRHDWDFSIVEDVTGRRGSVKVVQIDVEAMTKGPDATPLKIAPDAVRQFA